MPRNQVTVSHRDFSTEYLSEAYNFNLVNHHSALRSEPYELPKKSAFLLKNPRLKCFTIEKKLADGSSPTRPAPWRPYAPALRAPALLCSWAFLCSFAPMLLGVSLLLCSWAFLCSYAPTQINSGASMVACYRRKSARL